MMAVIMILVTARKEMDLQQELFTGAAIME